MELTSLFSNENPGKFSSNHFPLQTRKLLLSNFKVQVEVSGMSQNGFFLFFSELYWNEPVLIGIKVINSGFTQQEPYIIRVKSGKTQPILYAEGAP